MKHVLKKLKLVAWMFWNDENAFRRWMRLLTAALSTTGVLYTTQVEQIFGHKVGLVFQGMCVLATMIAAIHGDKVNKPAQEESPQVAP